MKLASICLDEGGTIGAGPNGSAISMDWDTGEIIEGPFEFTVTAGTDLAKVHMTDGRWAFIRIGTLVGGSRRKS